MSARGRMSRSMLRSDSIRLGGLVVAMAACSHSETLRPRPTKAEIIAECSGGSGNEVRLANGVDDDAPSLVLEENHDHGLQPAQPTLAVWSDGRVLFGHALPNEGRPKFELLQGRIPTSTVHKLIEDVAKELVTAPRHTDAFGNYIVSGGQLTTITVHVGDRWISASVYDAYEEDFLATTAGPRVEKKPEPPSSTASESEIDTSAFVSAINPPAPPPAFSRAYVRILETRPDRGAPFVPDDFGLTFFGPDHGTMKQSEMAWPHDLPPAPLNIDPDACSPYRTDGCSYILDEKYRSAARRFHASLRANNWPYFVLNGKRFSVRVDDFYQGERSIKAISTCSHHLADQQRAK